MPDFKMIPIDEVGYDPAFYPRAGRKEDWYTVNVYKEALLAHPWKADASRPGAFPPIVVVKADGHKSYRYATAGEEAALWPYIVIDGLHRLRAFSGAGLEGIAAEVERLPRSKWLERSVELNVVGKRTLTPADKRWAMKRLEAQGYRPEKITALFQMTPATFEKMTATNVHKLTAKQAREIPEGIGNREVNGGRFGFLKSAFGEVAGTANAGAVLEAQAPVTSRTHRQIVDSFLALLASGCLDLTEEMVARLAEARQLLAAVLGPEKD